MSAPTKPKVVHVYRSTGTLEYWIANPRKLANGDSDHEYLGEYVPAPGPVVQASDELARLRRMADAYAEDNRPQYWTTDIFGNHIYGCDICKATCVGSTDVAHAATCDVAAHLGLPREKGEGE